MGETPVQLVSDTLCVALGHLLEAFSDSQLVATSAGPGCTAFSSIRLWGQASNCPKPSMIGLLLPPPAGCLPGSVTERAPGGIRKMGLVDLP